VKDSQLGPNGGVDSPWSAVRSFTVTGPGVAPAAPVFITPTSPASFHVAEFFDIKWSAVTGAYYYLLEVDDEPTFSYPLTLTTNAITFGTKAQAGWGNALANVYYRVRAVSADNVRSLPSALPTPRPYRLRFRKSHRQLEQPFRFRFCSIGQTRQIHRCPDTTYKSIPVRTSRTASFYFRASRDPIT
jgi:hypothetical protein